MYLFCLLIFYSYIITLFFTLHHHHWHFILLHHALSCFFVQIANVHFHHQEVFQYIVTHVIMITTIHLCHHHQLRHLVIQQNIIQLTKRQLMIFSICHRQKNKKHLMQIIQLKLILIINNHQTIV